MATKLKDLKLTSVDLVDRGANPDAHIRLFKRKKVAEESDTEVKKDATTFSENVQQERLYKVTQEMFDFSYAFSDSLSSIIWDDEMDETAKLDMMYKSLDEFAETIRNSAPMWSTGKCIDKAVSKQKKPESQIQAFDAFWKAMTNEITGPDNNSEAVVKGDNHPQGDDNPQEDNHSQIKEEIDLKIDKSKMTPEEQAQLADFEKKYGVEDSAASAVQELHPDVKKALAEFEEVKKAQAAEIAKQKDELEALRKRVEMEQLAGFAKKYEVIGKKSDELAQKLYDLKKAGGTAYSDYVGLLDEHLATVEKSGLFRELGRNTSGSADVNDKLEMAAAEFKKSIQGLNNTEALIKAFEANPELAAQYDKEYMGGK